MTVAHFARIDENGFVVQVLVTDNNDPNGDEGFAFLTQAFGGVWVQTSYNTFANSHQLGGVPVRGNYASLGMSYDKERDLFLYPKPFASWVLNEATASWQAPVTDTRDPFTHYEWNEEEMAWKEIQ